MLKGMKNGKSTVKKRKRGRDKTVNRHRGNGDKMYKIYGMGVE